MRDFRDAWRALRAAPIISAVAVVSLALGIGANTAIFSIVNSLLLRTLPIHEPERLALVADQEDTFTYPVWEQVREREALWEGAFAWSNQRFNVAPSGESDIVEGLYVSGRLFEILGVPAMLGRTIGPEDDRRGGGRGGPVAVISYGFWQTRFGGAAEVVGTTLRIERVPVTIVGVTPPEFFGLEAGRSFDVAVPFGVEPLIRQRSMLDDRSAWWLTIMVRRKPGQTLEAAQAALRGVQSQIREATIPSNWRPSELDEYLRTPLSLLPGAGGSPFVRNRFQAPILALMVVVSLVLLIACANIANLMLARSAARRHELSVRLALGASRRRLARQLLSESLLLSVVGGALGLVLARWAGVFLVQQLSTSTSRLYLDLGVDGRVLLFTAGVAIGTAILFGTAPAFRATRVDLQEVLKEQGRGAVAEARVGLASLLVVAQVALSLVLVVSAGLFVRTFASLATLDLGFEEDRVLVTMVNAERSSTKPDPESRLALFERLRTAAAAAPGVASASASVVTPVAGMVFQFRVDVPGAPEMSERDRIVHVNIVSPDFFRTLGTQLLGGRDFTPIDRDGAAPVAIVNDAFVNTFMNGSSPIGRTVEHEWGPARRRITREIVGYVDNAVYRNLRQPSPPTLYIPLAQAADDPFVVRGTQISVRAATGAPALLTRSVAHALTSIDPDLVLTFRPLGEQVRNSLAQERVVAMVSAFFGGLALLLAALGLYGITAYGVSRRKGEIGIRMALGADGRAVLGMVLRRVALLVIAGIATGTIVSLWAMRFVETLLFGLEPRDPATIAMAAAVLAVIGAIAGWLPARRASRIDPAQVLREV